MMIDNCLSVLSILSIKYNFGDPKIHKNISLKHIPIKKDIEENNNVLLYFIWIYENNLEKFDNLFLKIFIEILSKTENDLNLELISTEIFYKLKELFLNIISNLNNFDELLKNYLNNQNDIYNLKINLNLL